MWSGLPILAKAVLIPSGKTPALDLATPSPGGYPPSAVLTSCTPPYLLGEHDGRFFASRPARSGLPILSARLPANADLISSRKILGVLAGKLLRLRDLRVPQARKEETLSSAQLLD